MEPFRRQGGPTANERFAGFAHRFAGHLATPGAQGIVARQAGEVAGVIYGWPAAPEVPETPFCANVYGAADPDHQGRGLGRELLTRLVEPHPQAWLCR